MKKLVLIIVALHFLTAITAQTIQFYYPTVIYRASAAISPPYVLRYSIVNHNLARQYDVTVTDKLEGTARQGIDYTLTSNPYSRGIATFINVDTTYQIILPAIDNCNTTDKTIVLHIEAIPQQIGEATIKDSIKLTIHRTDHLTAAQKKGCREDARNTGTSWPLNNGGINVNDDTTNVPKTEFITYTDIKGFDPDQPNGLAQTQFTFKWPIVKQWNIVNHPKFKVQLLRSFILPNLLLNRIDKTNDVLLFKPISDSFVSASGMKDSFVIRSRNVNSFDLVKYSNIQVNSIVALLNLKFPNSRLLLEWNINLYRMRVDSSKIRTNFDPVYAFSNGPELFFETGNSDAPDKFQLRSTLSYEKIKILSNSFSQVDGISTRNDDLTLTDPKTLTDHYVDKSSPIWKFTARLSRSISKDDKTSIFFRYSLSEQRIKNGNVSGDQSLKNTYNFFSQYQVGLSLSADTFGK